MRIRVFAVILAVLSTGLFAVAQETASNTSVPSTSTPAASAISSVPRLVRFSGVAKDTDSKPLTGTVGITFLLYKDQQGGAPIWMETQNVQSDSSGHYSIQLGSTLPDGLPTDIFTSGEARWLGVQISGQTEQPRVLLLSVPYALKAADAETIGGLPPSAFVKATPAGGSSSVLTGSENGVGNASTKIGNTTNNSGNARLVGVTTSGVGPIGALTLFQTNTHNIEKSIVTQNGANIGIGTATPTANLDLEGNAAATSAPIFWLKNNAAVQSGGTGNAVDLRFTPDGGGKVSTPNAYIRAQENGNSQYGTFLSFGTVANSGNGASERMRLDSNGNVGIGTGTPRSLLDIDATVGSGLGPTLTLSNNESGGTGSSVSLDFNTYGPFTSGTYNPSARIWVQDAGAYSNNLLFQSNKPGNPNQGLQTNMVIQSDGNVGIGTTTPIHTLDVAGSVGISGALASYNGSPTAGNGLAIIVYALATTEKTAVGFTNVFAVSGLFRLTIYAVCTVGDGTSGDGFSVNFLWTDETGTQSVTIPDNQGAKSVNCGLTAGDFAQGTVIVHLPTGNTINLETPANVIDANRTGTYNLYYTIEKLE